MLRTLEAVIDQHGTVRLLEAVQLPGARRALVVILEDEATPGASDVALLSEAALADGWDRPEEEAAWSHLQRAGSS